MILFCVGVCNKLIFLLVTTLNFMNFLFHEGKEKTVPNPEAEIVVCPWGTNLFMVHSFNSLLEKEFLERIQFKKYM